VGAAGAARPSRVAVELMVLTPGLVSSLYPLIRGSPGGVEGGEVLLILSGSGRGCTAVWRAARAVRRAAGAVELPLFVVDCRHVRTAGRLRGDGRDAGGGGFVV
jgi:hypothetical protein